MKCQNDCRHFVSIPIDSHNVRKIVCLYCSGRRKRDEIGAMRPLLFLVLILSCFLLKIVVIKSFCFSRKAAGSLEEAYVAFTHAITSFADGSCYSCPTTTTTCRHPKIRRHPKKKSVKCKEVSYFSKLPIASNSSTFTFRGLE